MQQEYVLKKEFFASANGYSGFKSYFDSVFNSYEFDRIFVLKGGPGTGKSTLMKTMLNSLKNRGLSAEVFRCSSDSNSLDGLIFSNEKKRIAVIDGTAPHERDAVVPGVVDVLINLGEAIKNEEIEKSKQEILSLNSLKKAAYLNAYDQLRKSSVFARNSVAEIYEALDFECINKLCSSIISDLNIKNKSSGVRLFSSFSKDGYVTLESFKSALSMRYTVRGEYGSELIFMTLLSNRLREEKIPFLKIVSPVDENLVEGIYFKDDNIGIIGGHGGNCIYDTSDCFISSKKSTLTEKVRALQKCKEFYEEEAKKFLLKASEYHFALEKIYTSSVDFDIINSYTGRMIDYASKIFS